MPEPEVFLDTNVLLYSLSSEPAKANRVEALVSAGGVISVQVLNELASVGLRKLGLTLVEIREILATVRALCMVVPVDISVHELGLEMVQRYQLNLYDGMIVAAALRSGCTILYSEDMQHQQTFGSLRIVNPFA